MELDKPTPVSCSPSLEWHPRTCSVPQEPKLGERGEDFDWWIHHAAVRAPFKGRRAGYRSWQV